MNNIFNYNFLDAFGTSFRKFIILSLNKIEKKTIQVSLAVFSFFTLVGIAYYIFKKGQSLKKETEISKINQYANKFFKDKIEEDEEFGFETSSKKNSPNEEIKDEKLPVDSANLNKTEPKEDQPVKKMSRRTKILKEKLENLLKKKGKVLGDAIDNGDCFYDSFAANLKPILKREVTIKELREKVRAEAVRLSKGPEHENWIKKSGLVDDYTTYLKEVGFTYEEILKKDFPFKGIYPPWGLPNLEGVILCSIYKVNLIVHTVGCLDDHDLNNEENFYEGLEEYPAADLPYENSIEIAIYPGHFMPVFPK